MELKMTDVVVITVAIMNVQSSGEIVTVRKSTPSVFRGRMAFWSPSQVSEHWKEYVSHFTDLQDAVVLFVGVILQFISFTNLSELRCWEHSRTIWVSETNRPGASKYESDSHLYWKKGPIRMIRVCVVQLSCSVSSYWNNTPSQSSRPVHSERHFTPQVRVCRRDNISQS